MKVNTIKDIQKIFREENPKNVCLLDSSGNFVSQWNSPKIKAKIRFEEIIKKLSSVNIPDGLYTFCYRDSMWKNAPEYSVTVGKGSYNPNEITTVTHVQERKQLTGSNPPEVWTLKEALDTSTEKIRLELHNEQLKKENKELQQANEFLKSKGKEVEEKGSDFFSGMKEFFEAVQPLVDKVIEQEDRRITLKEKSLSQTKQLNKSTGTKREDGGEPFDSEKYPDYFHHLFSEMPEDVWGYELEEMQKFDSEMHDYYCKHYGIEFQDSEPETTEQNTTEDE